MRPNPDKLLERLTAEERKRGRLKIYLGMAAGSGKTYAMLADAIVEKHRGIDIVAGYIEPHGRVETEELAAQLEQLPYRFAEHKGIKVREFDLDKALERKPRMLLVDEFAHTNSPGSRHPKRWQDIEECLAQGINVFTTLNVQHIESLTDVVTKITGISVFETVPDSVVRRADEIELVDVTPEELIQRIKDGKVYLTDKVDSALSNFFRPGNLMALRELVLRFAAEQVDAQLINFRQLHDIQEVWPARPRVLVCVSPNYLAERVVRSARRLANSLHTELIAVTVENSSHPVMSQGKGTGRSGLDLAEQLGAEVVRCVGDDIVVEILKVAGERNATIVVMGKPVRSRIRDYFFGSVVDELIRSSGELDVYVITDKTGESNIPLLPRYRPPTGKGIFSAIGVTAIATVACAIAQQFLAPPNLVMFFLLAVAWAGSRLGQFESVITSILSVLAFDFFFVPPTWTFVVDDFQYIVTFSVMLVISLLISTLTRRLRAQSDLASRRERHTATLYDVSKRLASAVSISQIATIVEEKSVDLFGSEGVIIVPDGKGDLKVYPLRTNRLEREPNELAVARWASIHKIPAGAGTETLTGAKGQYVPLTPDAEQSPVLGIFYGEDSSRSPTDPLVGAFTTQVGSALERVMAEEESTNVKVQVERERIRNVLLSSISHDFRSPLAVITGATETLKERHNPKDQEGKELLQSIKDESDRLTRLVRNVLDLTRLESGDTHLKIEWESIEELIGAALERSSSLLSDRSIDIRLPSPLPLVRVDATLFEQVFVNLIENVAKHTPKDSRLEISGRVDGSQLILEFCDAGPGVPVGKELLVFEKAFRGSETGEGYGLGLAICHAILKAHGSSISVSNKPPMGACFRITIPLPEKQPEVSNVT